MRPGSERNVGVTNNEYVCARASWTYLRSEALNVILLTLKLVFLHKHREVAGLNLVDRRVREMKGLVVNATGNDEPRAP